MIEPFLEWLRNTEGLPFNSSALADHLTLSPVVIVQDVDSLRMFSEFWNETLVPRGTKIIATPQLGGWSITAMVDVRNAHLQAFAYQQLNYIPTHLLFEISVGPAVSLNSGTIAVRALCGAVGGVKPKERFYDVTLDGIRMAGGDELSETDHTILGNAREALGLWKFHGLEAMSHRHLIAIKPNYLTPRYVLATTFIRDVTNGIH